MREAAPSSAGGAPGRDGPRSGSEAAPRTARATPLALAWRIGLRAAALVRAQGRGWPGWAGRVALAAVATVAALPLSESAVFRIGLVLVFAIASIGLHILVNWAGELSLAHAAMVGLPAFVVAKLGSDHNLSPLELIPVGILVGLALGGLTAVAALRAHGLQVAVVTLAMGIAVDRFFFTKAWLIGTGNLALPPPRLGGIELGTVHRLFPVLVAATLLAVGVGRKLLGSKVGRALLQVRARPALAAARGIDVFAYRASAYLLAGAFAGLAGALTPLWVQRLAPESFPLSASLTYLTVVVVAGPGPVGGVLLASAAFQGLRLFLPPGSAVVAYLGPVALVATLIRFPGGLNEAVGMLRRRPQRPARGERRSA